jgi:hypothetical protein
MLEQMKVLMWDPLKELGRVIQLVQRKETQKACQLARQKALQMVAQTLLP